MHKFTTLIIAASVAMGSVSLGTAVRAGEVLDRILDTNTLRVATGADWGPVAHLNQETNELEGYDIDVSKGIAKYLGVNAEFITPGWDLIVAANWADRWDIAAAGMAPTKERAEKLDFSIPYFADPTAIVVHKDSKAEKASDIDGKIVGVVNDSIAEQHAKQTFKRDDGQPVQYDFKAGEVKTYQTSNIAFDDLRLGEGVRLDAVLTDKSFAEAGIKSGYPLKIIATFYPVPVAIPMMKGDPELLQKVNEAIKKMREDGTLSKASIKWYGTDLTVVE